jgi:hypothetical protein
MTDDDECGTVGRIIISRGKYSEKTYTSATLSTTNPTWLDVGSPGGGKPTIKRLSNGRTVFSIYYILLHTLETDEYLKVSIERWKKFQYYNVHFGFSSVEQSENQTAIPISVPAYHLPMRIFSSNYSLVIIIISLRLPSVSRKLRIRAEFAVWNNCSILFHLTGLFVMEVED